MTEKRRPKLLLVEDEAIIAMGEKRELEEYGYEVAVVHSGHSAVARAEEDRTLELILMDIDLGGGMDGTEAASTILSRRYLPLIFLSSHTERDIVEKTEGITSYGYVVKSSGITVLDAAIKMAFRLYDAQLKVREQNMQMEAANEELRVTNEEITGWRNLLDQVVHHDPAAIAVLDNELRFLYVSQRFVRDYGLETSLIGRHHYDAVPDIPEKWREVHRRALNGEVLSSQFDTFERADGRTDYTRWECRPWYRPDDTVGGIVLYTEVLNDRVQSILTELGEGRLRDN